MSDAKRIAWLTVEEMLGKSFSSAATGTPSASTYLRGDNTWASASAGTVASTDISDATATGRAVIVAASQAAARTAIGAGTSTFDGAYLSLTGIPSVFAPDVHTHLSADITAPDIATNLFAPTADKTIPAGYGSYIPEAYEIADQKYLECGDGAIMEIG